MRGAKAVKTGILLALLLAPLLPADAFLDRVRAKITGSQPFRADFVQQVFIDGEMSLEESGFIIFVDRDHVKWQYLRPEFKTFIMENGRYQFYDRENNQLVKGSIGPGNEQIIWELLCSPKPGQVSRWEERTRTILLRTGQGPDAQELKIKVGPDFLPEKVEQSSTNEVSNLYLFRNYRTGITLEAGEFALNLPASVEIIEED